MRLIVFCGNDIVKESDDRFTVMLFSGLNENDDYGAKGKKYYVASKRIDTLGYGGGDNDNDVLKIEVIEY